MTGHLFGWCETKGRPDQFHQVCEAVYTNSLGVEVRCSCPNHPDPEDDN